MAKLKFKKFTAATIDATEKVWCRSRANHAFFSDVRALIEKVKKLSVYADKTLESYTYGVFEEKTPHALAVIEVIVSKSGRKLIKMIDCVLEPSIEDGAIQSKPEALQLIPEIYSEAVQGTISLTVDHKVDLVKVYGRSGELLRLLTATAHHINKKSPHLPVKIQGRWLVVGGI